MMAYRINVTIEGIQQHVLGAQLLQGFQVGSHLLERALASDTLVFRERRLSQAQPNMWTQRRYAFTLVSGNLLQARQVGVSQPVNTDANRGPGITIPYGTVQGRITGATDPDGRIGSTPWPWGRVHLLEGYVVPLERRHIKKSYESTPRPFSYGTGKTTRKSGHG